MNDKNTYAGGLILKCEHGHEWRSEAVERRSPVGKKTTLVSPRIVQAMCPTCGAMYEGFRKIGMESARKPQPTLEDYKQALTALMPFVLEEYVPSCATPAYKAAVERAKELTGMKEEQRNPESENA